jgi:hypothetical protein
LFPRFASRTIRNRICCNTKKPGNEGRAAPFELAEICQGLMKDVSSQVLSFRAIVYPPRYVCINAVEVVFIKLRKAARIFLSRLDQESFFGFVTATQA